MVKPNLIAWIGGDILFVNLFVAYIIGMVYWHADIPVVTVIDLEKINNYGLKYPSCDIINTYNYTFYSYDSFTCGNKCVDFCVQNSKSDQTYRPDLNTLTRLSVNCILIKVHNNNDAIKDMTFNNCYKNIIWSDIESIQLDHDSASYTGWLVIVIICTMLWLILWIVFLVFNAVLIDNVYG